MEKPTQAPPKPKKSFKDILLQVKTKSHQVWLLLTQEDNLVTRPEKRKKRAIWIEVPLMVKGLFSKDKATRMGSIFFFLSLFVVTLLFKTTLNHYWTEWKVAHELRAKILEEQRLEAKKKEDEIELRKASTVSLGIFIIELKKMKDQTHSRALNLAEIEIAVICEEKETAKFIEDNLGQVRSQISTYIGAMERQELMSVEGKRWLKENLKKKINMFLPQGKVKEVYIPRFTLN